jgi:heme/copper-type cytochrome/quinol oxidase subunit 1
LLAQLQVWILRGVLLLMVTIATYDAKLPSTKSVYNWFCVQKRGNQPLGTPMALFYQFIEENSIPEYVITQMVLNDSSYCWQIIDF